MKLPFTKSQGKQTATKKPESQGGSLTIARVGALWCVLASSLIIATAYFAGQWYVQNIKDQRQQTNQLEAKDLADQINTLMQSYRVRGEMLASDRRLIDLLSTDDVVGLQQKEQQIQQQLPDTIRVRIIKAGVERLEAGDFPELTFTDIEMLASAETTGKSPPVEAHSMGSPEQHFEVIIPITATSQFIGSLMLSFSAGEITGLIGSVELPQGYIELVQRDGGQAGISLANKGDAALKGTTVAASVPVSDSRWTMDYYGVTDADLEQAALRYIYGGAGVLVLLLIVVTILCVRILMIAIRSDLIVLNNLVFDKWSNRVKSRYPVRIKHYQDLVESILNMGGPAPTTVQAKKQARPQALNTGLESIVDAAEAVQNPKPVQQQQQAAVVRRAVPASIFKAYDIRGIVGKTLTDDLVYHIGLAIGSEAEVRGQQTVVVARDGRLSGAEYAAALSKGLRASGRDVIDIGMAPTPLLYFATHHLNTGSGVMVTGSHNPPDYNGFKIMLGGETLSGSTIQSLRKRVESEQYSSGKGKYTSMDISADYIERVTSDVNVCRPIKLVVDCGNGVAGAVAPQLLRALGCEVHELYSEVDGNFPNHHPDPSKPENLKDLTMSVIEHDADIGLAFDGDGDRLGVVDSNGTIIWPDRQMMLYATDVLSRNPGAEIIYDVKCSSHLHDVITKAGGKPLMWKTGHSLIKAKLKETGDLLAGEMSGHIFFKERWYGFDDGLYTAARLLEILAMDPRPSGEVFAELPNAMNTPEINVEMAEDKHFEFMNSLLAEAQFPGARITTIDGIRADFEDGWGLVRASNTTPCLVMRFEASNAQAMKRIQDQFKKSMLKLKPDLKFPF